MNFKKIILLSLMLVVIVSGFGLAKPRIIINEKNPIKFAPMSPDVLVIQRVNLQANNINAIFQNSGIFDQNTASTNTPGLEWPKGANKFACFTAGLSLGCKILAPVPNQPDTNLKSYQFAQVMASYGGEYTPGWVQNVNGVLTPITGADFKIYNIKLGDNAANSADWANWGKMVAFGAPFEDKNNNGTYDPLVDVPGQKNAAQTLFMTMTDAFIEQKNAGEGFGGGVPYPLLYAEVHFTAWAYNTPGLEDLEFINWVVINKGYRQWDSTFMSVVVDPDLGDANDDYIGCDRTLNMGFCYNGDDNDPIYGAAPPAFGMDYFKSPIIRRPGIPNDTLGLTSFVFFTNTGSGPPPCESDPNGEPIPAYLMMQGLKKDGSPFMDPTVTPPVQTKYVYPGDPETNIGWTEVKGSVQNCGGTTGTIIATNPTGDRRFIFNSGRYDFSYLPGDTQNIVLAQFVARGQNNKNSVTRLKGLSKTAQIIYDNNFNVTPPPPPPVVNYSISPLTNGLCNITLNWGDISESYNYLDTIFYPASVNNRYKFEGYEIYEIDKNANSLPNFTKPETIGNEVALVDIFDLRNNIGVIIDTFSTGIVVGQNEQYSPYQIVPPYKMVKPANFPNHGISRSINLTGTKYPQNYNGNTNFIYGQEYHFAVVAYGYSAADSIRRGFKVIRNSVSAQVLKIRPTAPPLGTVYTMKNGDTLNVNFPIRDLGLIPIIKNQDQLLNATYRLVFNADTTYNILKKLQGAVDFDTLKRGLKYLNYKSATEDSSRIIDGVYMNLQKIRFIFGGAIGDYTGNIGVIRDLTLSADSIQTRKNGWEYKPAQNNPFLGAKILANNQEPNWQSKSISLSYPTKYTFVKNGSALKPDRLTTYKIVFTSDTNSGQIAYRFCAKTNNPPADPSFAPYIVNTNASTTAVIYQDKRRVPFQVFEVNPYDSTEAPRQVNVAFAENNDTIPRGLVNGRWDPTSDSTGSYEILYIFNSNYGDPAWDAYYAQPTRNLFISLTVDIAYIWAPRLANSGAKTTAGDEFYIYPYHLTRPYFQASAPNKPMFYEFSTIAPTYGDPNVAKNENALDKINVVPNPYYGYSTLDRTISDKFVTFRNLPLNCTIKIYTLGGDLIRTLNKSATGNITNSSTIEWNLQNQDRVPVASGIYVALIDAPGIGQKVLKIVIFTAQERINF